MAGNLGAARPSAADSGHGCTASLQLTRLRLVELSSSVCEYTANWSGVIRETAESI
jgi:hypothetical protein